MDNKQLSWSCLTLEEKEQAENSYLSIMEDCALGGDDWDKAWYQELLNDKDLRIDLLKGKSFRRENGYICVLS